MNCFTYKELQIGQTAEFSRIITEEMMEEHTRQALSVTKCTC